MGMKKQDVGRAAAKRMKSAESQSAKKLGSHRTPHKGLGTWELGHGSVRSTSKINCRLREQTRPQPRCEKAGKYSRSTDKRPLIGPVGAEGVGAKTNHPVVSIDGDLPQVHLKLAWLGRVRSVRVPGGRKRKPCSKARPVGLDADRQQSVGKTSSCGILACEDRLTC